MAGDKHEMTLEELQRRFAECDERIAQMLAKGDERMARTWAKLDEGRAEFRARTRETWRLVERLRAENAEMRRRA